MIVIKFFVELWFVVIIFENIYIDFICVYVSFKKEYILLRLNVKLKIYFLSNGCYIKLWGEREREKEGWGGEISVYLNIFVLV